MNTCHKKGPYEVQYPALKFSKKPLIDLSQKYFDSHTIIITDSHNFKSLKQLDSERIIPVKNNYVDQIAQIKKTYKYDKVIGIGGCTALDVARACNKNLQLILIPTILSTSCLSVDRSVIRYDGKNRLEKTVAPAKIIISIPELLATKNDALTKWCQSGYGDFFSSISASIELEYKKGNFSMEDIKKNVPLCFEVIEQINKRFTSYRSVAHLQRLAVYLHEASLWVIQNDSTELNAAGEHKIYHKIIENKLYTNGSEPTHGQIVAMGTLITVKIFDEMTGNSLFIPIKKAFDKLKLATDYKKLMKTGLKKEHIIESIDMIKDSGSLIGDYFQKNDYSLLDRIFGIYTDK